MIHYKDDPVERAQRTLEALFGREWLMEGSETMHLSEAEQRELDQRSEAAEARRAERVPAQYYDFPYDGHAVFHPSWGLRIQVLDQGYAQMSATEARQFSDWLAGLVKNVPRPVPQGWDVVDG